MRKAQLKSDSYRLLAAALRIMLGILALSLPSASPARAHGGPPYPLFMDKAVGPYTVAVWADPDVGVGTFYILPRLTGKNGQASFPGELAVSVVVQPVTGRLPEATHPARREEKRDGPQYIAEVPFDAEERWRVRVLLSGSDRQQAEELTTEVEVTPEGFGVWDIALYGAPFLLIAGLWLHGYLKTRRKKE